MRRIGIVALIALVLLTACSSGKGKLTQLENIKKGDTVAVIDVREYGQMKLKLFPDKTPATVENFTELAKTGYYDGLAFTTVVEDFFVMTGNAEDGDTVSSFGGFFEDEFSEDLLPVRGALCMANLGEADTNSSQFFIVGQTKEQLEKIDELLAFKGYALEDYIERGYNTKLSMDQLEEYFEYGGTPWIYGHNTVFGQLLEGFDVLDAIMSAQTADAHSYVPVDDIVIENITVYVEE
ncbi:MAG: peptidylprolyl isomerase [Lachnospiraceae bacterium]|nr:peptidylprolyl isomerase [Lachnospiraceae bacterium]